jgi:hypothetical protein
VYEGNFVRWNSNEQYVKIFFFKIEFPLLKKRNKIKVIGQKNWQILMNKIITYQYGQKDKEFLDLGKYNVNYTPSDLIYK